MSSSNDNDDQQRFALGFLFALIALVVSTVVGVVVYKRAIQPARAPVAATAVVAAPEAVILPVTDVASIKLENGIVKFYFATGKSDVAAGANEALADVAKGVASGKKARCRVSMTPRGTRRSTKSWPKSAPSRCVWCW